ncbi:MAG: hypothetical protein ACK4WH_10390 [Phycisphaerales bacterium]
MRAASDLLRAHAGAEAPGASGVDRVRSGMRGARRGAIGREAGRAMACARRAGVMGGAGKSAVTEHGARNRAGRVRSAGEGRKGGIVAPGRRHRRGTVIVTQPASELAS